MATLSPVELSDEVCDRVDAAARHLCNSHLAPHPDQKKKALANLAESMLWFRKNCLRLDGKMDLHGQSKQCKFIVKLIREKAGEPGSPLEMPTSVAHRVGELIFNDPDISDDTRRAYGLGDAPAHVAARQRHSDQLAQERARQRSSLSENIAQIINAVEQLELPKLDDADDAERERVVERLSRLEAVVSERLSEIGEIF
ncbi:hypothetical protein ACH347_14720 [Saccharopolyspora sp. 5N102]|uniref:hypothetical protein n=1 Tax=Saccharopolyspora sp. 5N102 TaxID=3375155 RepID=UPI0037980BC1